MAKKPLKVIVAIQARMGSKRLPDKPLKKIGGKTVMALTIERVLRSKEADEVVLATTYEQKDNVLEKIARQMNVPCFRGSESDLLLRLWQTVVVFNADALVRITGDSPLMDATVIDRAIKEFRKFYPKYDQVTTCLPLTYPEGFSLEVISRRALDKLHAELKTSEEREAFIIFLSRNKKEFPRLNLPYKKDASHIRLTLDYPEDFQLTQKIFTNFTEKGKEVFGVEEIVSFLEKNPKFLEINRHLSDRSKYPFSIDAAAIKKAL